MNLNRTPTLTIDHQTARKIAEANAPHCPILTPDFFGGTESDRAWQKYARGEKRALMIMGWFLVAASLLIIGLIAANS